MTVKRADWVTTESGGKGIVRRLAKDGSWADVRWFEGGEEWSKRMPTTWLIPLHTITFPRGTMTDMTRKKEMENR